MTDLYSWPLPPEVQEEIEAEQVKIHDKYWPQLCALDVHEPTMAEKIGLVRPAPIAKQPRKLARILGEYALELFTVEVGKYPRDPQLELRVRHLGNYVVETIAERMAHLENPTYHLHIDQMKQGMIECLVLRIDALLSVARNIAADVEVKAPEEKMRDETSGHDKNSLRAPESCSQVDKLDPVAAQRRALLDAYKGKARERGIRTR
jgi:hypothetical protein